MTTVEVCVLRGFRLACDEGDLELADRLLEALELIEARRARAALDRTDQTGEGPALRAAYAVVAELPPRPR